MAADTAYAKSLGIEMGGYTLMQNPKDLTGDDTCHSPDARAGPVPTYIADFSTAFHRRYRENIVAFLRHMLARTLPLPLPLPLLHHSDPYPDPSPGRPGPCDRGTRYLRR